MSLSVCVITLNEEKNLRDCLESVRWADEIVVVDGESKDGTRAIAEKYSAKIRVRPFTDFSDQKNFAHDLATRDWVLWIDADERLSAELAAEVRAAAASPNADCVYAVKRDTFFFGRRMKYGAARNDWPIRLFPRGHAVYTQPVHEKLVTTLPVKRLRGGVLLHHSTAGMAQYREKMERYVALELMAMAERRRRVGPLHPVLAPAVKFFRLWLWDLGILDGLTGLRFALLAAYYDAVRYGQYRKFCRKAGEVRT